MGRQNLGERAAVIALTELSGKITTRQARDHLKAKGLLPDEADLVDEGQLDFTRRIFQRTRRYKDLEGNGKIGFVSLFEKADDGSKLEYYKRAEETSVDEAVQDLEYWHRYRSKGQQRLNERFKLYSKIHGKRKLLRRINFPIQGELSFS